MLVFDDLDDRRIAEETGRRFRFEGPPVIDQALRLARQLRLLDVDDDFDRARAWILADLAGEDGFCEPEQPIDLIVRRSSLPVESLGRALRRHARVRAAFSIEARTLRAPRRENCQGRKPQFFQDRGEIRRPRTGAERRSDPSRLRLGVARRRRIEFNFQ